VDLDTAERALISLGNMATNHPEIKEMDINPLLVHPDGQGATVADCRIVLQTTEESGGSHGQ
jgi:acetate---CoA ligase (ADP-forming)